MEIRRTTLIRAIIVFIVISIIGAVLFSVYNKKHKEVQLKAELEEIYNRMVDDEYKALINEYERYVDIVFNRDYDDGSRCKAVFKIRDLLPYPVFSLNSSSDTWITYDFIQEYKEGTKDKKARDILKRKATSNATLKYNKQILGIE